MELQTYAPVGVDHREQRFTGQFTIGSSGAITVASTPPVALTGVTSIIKETAAGRYTLTLYRPFKRFKAGRITFVRASSTAPANTTGETGQPGFHTEDVDGAGTIVLQCSRGSDGADANVTSGVVITYEITVTDA